LCSPPAIPWHGPVGPHPLRWTGCPRWTLHSYWDGENCRYPPFREALAIEQANHAQLQQALADLHPDVVTFWHMGALSLGLITATAHLSLPLVWTAGTLERDMPWPGRLSGSGWPSSVVPAPAVASSSLCSGRSNCPRGASMPTR
jgi:hypothetical protein